MGRSNNYTYTFFDDFIVDYPTKEGFTELLIEATVIPGYEGVTGRKPEDCYEGESDEIDEVKVLFIRSGVEFELEDFLHKQLIAADAEVVAQHIYDRIYNEWKYFASDDGL